MLRVDLNLGLKVVLMYPILLFLPTIIGYEAFFITAPYFFIVFIGIFSLAIFKTKTLKFSKVNLLIFMFISLVGMSLWNFHSIRYSLPIFFVLYVLLYFWFFKNVKNKYLSDRFLIFYYYFILILSFPFVFLENGYTEENRFIGFIGSPTVYSGFLVSFFIMATHNWSLRTLKFITLFGITFYLVYLTQTRLLLIVLFLLPLLRILASKKIWATRKLMFFVFYFSTLLIYPLYSLVVDLFPQLVTLRYGNKKDTSFNLRNYLFEELKNLYSKGTWSQKLFGRGNEYSRKYVNDIMGIDLMPHNDYLRILVDWGLLGFIIFSIILYKVSIKSNICLYLSLVYMVLFYSNTIFNLFLVSLLIIFYLRTESRGKCP